MEIERPMAWRYKRRLFPIGILCLLCLAGCGSGPLVGMVYTHVKMPLTRDLNASPVKEKNGTGGVIKIKEPFSGYGIYAEINSNAIGEIARKHGIETIYFADKEIFSILGIWTTTNVTIYGSSARRPHTGPELQDLKEH